MLWKNEAAKPKSSMTKKRRKRSIINQRTQESADNQAELKYLTRKEEGRRMRRE